MPHAGIVTVSYGSGEHLTQFLTSVREFCGSEQTIVVVDNKPDHENVRAVAETFSAHYLALPSNPGYGAGMNAGVKELRRIAGDEFSFDAFFVVNPDVTFIENSVTPLVETLLSEANVGSVGPTLLEEDGSVYPSAREIPSVSTGIGHAVFGVFWPSNPWTKKYKSTAGSDQQRDAGWLSGAAVMIKAEVWDAIGGFDEGYFLNFEDIDLGFRIGKAGYRNVYCPQTKVVHTGGHSLNKHEAISERAMHTSAVRFMRKRYAGFWHTPFRWAVVLGLKVRGVITLATIRKTKTPASGNTTH